MTDIANSYIEKSKQRAADSDAAQLDAMFSQPPMDVKTNAEIATDLFNNLPPRREASTSLGQVKPTPDQQSIAGKVMRNVAEIVPSAAKGVHNALMMAVDPLADWLNENVVDLTGGGKYTYSLSAPETATGQATEAITRFLTGFIPAVKAFKAVGVTNVAANSAAAGFTSGFATRDGHEGRMFDMWNQLGLPKSDFTEWMKTDNESPELVERLKNGMEEAGAGLLFDGVLAGIRTIRAARADKVAQKAEEKVLVDKYGKLTDDDMAKIVGDPSKPAIETKVVQPPAISKKIPKAAEQVPAFEPRAVIRGKRASKSDPTKSEDFETYINFATINEPDQVKFTIGKMAEAMKGQVDEARRGVITQEETKKMADDLGMTVAELLERRRGQPLNAEEALAARQLWAASGAKLLEAAKLAASPNAGALDQFAFRRAMAVHSAIQSEVIGARTETARALAQWKIPAGGDIEKARAIEQIMGAAGGPEASKDMARRLAILAETGASPATIARFAKQGMFANSVDAIKEVWVNGLLTSPKTHVVNTLSNSLVIFQQIYERAAAAGIRGLSGGDGVKAGEAAAMAFGITQSFKDAFRLAAKAFKTGETGYAFNKVDISHPNAISSEAFNLASETGAGKFVDFLGHVANVPGRLLGAEDEFFKTIGYRMELNAQAVRTAASEGLTGQAYRDRVIDLIANPPEHLRINAADAAMYNTFTNDMGWFGKGMMALRDSGGPLNPIVFVLPFIRTPTNIARYSFERSPLAPLVGQWRADIAAGGARADLALARMATGTAIMTTAMDFAANGMISGAGPSSSGPDKDIREAMTRSGWQPFSIKIGDRWVSYSRTDPFGMTVGLAASIVESVQNGELDEEDIDEWQEVAAMSIAAISQNVVNKTYMEGVANFVEMANDPTRYGESYINDMAASFIPFTALSGAVEGAVDPAYRDSTTPWEAIQAKIAGLSSNLTPRRDLWGRTMTNESGLGRVYDAISPVASRGENVQPIDHEIVRLGGGPQRIAKKTTFGGVRVSLRKWPQVYDEYVKLAGNELKHPVMGMGAMDYLNAVVSGNHPTSAMYKIMSDEVRKDFISNIVSEYRQLAQQQIMNDPRFADFSAEIARANMINQKAQMPVLGE